MAAQLLTSAAGPGNLGSAFPGHDRRYADPLDQELPRTECLKDTVARFLPYWHDSDCSAILAGKRVLIAAHGNSLRPW